MSSSCEKTITSNHFRLLVSDTVSNFPHQSTSSFFILSYLGLGAFNL